MRSFWLLLAAVPALAQPPCTVQTEERLASATTRFSVGPTTVAMTVPVGFRVNFLTVYLEVNNPQPDLFFQTGSQKVPAADGAAISLEPEIDARPAFTILNGQGQRLCSWQPNERVWAYDPPVVPTPAKRLTRLMRNVQPWFYIAGDPVTVVPVRTKTARDFTIDDVPARVLARSTRFVILRDPNPSAGFRTVKSQGGEVILAMVQVRKELSGNALRITVTGPEVLTGSAAVTIFNMNRGAAELHCGSAIHHHDWPEAARLPMSDDDKGVYTGTCSLKSRGQGEPQFDLVVEEQRLRPGPRMLPNRPAAPQKIDTYLKAQHG